jgi:dihydrofolate reductase
MRQIILNLAITFDGMIEGPNGELDWIVKDEETDFGDILNEILIDKDVIFYGRIAYEKFGNTKPDSNASQKIRDAYNSMNSKTKYVFSKTMKNDKYGATIISSGIKEKVLEIKQQQGKNIWLYGGAEIATTFFNLDLIDELRLAIHPVILGKGRALFENIEKKNDLVLLETKNYKSGVMLVKYKVKRNNGI